jgi:hypothetical protein
MSKQIKIISVSAGDVEKIKQDEQTFIFTNTRPSVKSGESLGLFEKKGRNALIGEVKVKNVYERDDYIESMSTDSGKYSIYLKTKTIPFVELEEQGYNGQKYAIEITDYIDYDKLIPLDKLINVNKVEKHFKGNYYVAGWGNSNCEHCKITKCRNNGVGMYECSLLTTKHKQIDCDKEICPIAKLTKAPSRITEVIIGE